jgi:hypothetical protein
MLGVCGYVTVFDPKQLAAAVINNFQSGNPVVYLTLIGGGVFRNNRSWILDAIKRSCQLYQSSALDVRIVSFSRSDLEVNRLVIEFS